ncbi:hypothetical protein D9M68_857110 [compost metagenome]
MKFRIGKVTHAFFKVVDTDDGSPREPQEHQGVRYRLLQTCHMPAVMPGLLMTLQQVPDHLGIAGKHQPDGNAAGQQMNINNRQPHQLHGFFLPEQANNCIKLHVEFST